MFKPVCTESSGLVKREVALPAQLATTAPRELGTSSSLAPLVLSTICRVNGSALFAPQATSAPSSLPRRLSAPSANSTHTSVWTDACPAQLATDAVSQVLWSQSPALPVSGRINSVQLSASTVSKVTSALMEPSSHLPALMVNSTRTLVPCLTKTASAAPLVATASRVPTSLGSAFLAPTRSLLARLNALTALPALSAGCLVWFQLSLAQLVPLRSKVNAWSPLLVPTPPPAAPNPSSAKQASSLTLVLPIARSAPLVPSARWVPPSLSCAPLASITVCKALLASSTASSVMLDSTAPRVPLRK